jgi:predicted GNAT family acetyltransferase
VNGRPVGTARLTDEELPVVVGVVTLPEARGRGVATAVTGALAARAVSERGVCALYVERGSQAQRIYRRIGFEPLFRTQAWHRAYRPPGP